MTERTLRCFRHCLQRGEVPRRKRLQGCHGYVHIDVCELRLAESKYLMPPGDQEPQAGRSALITRFEGRLSVDGRCDYVSKFVHTAFFDVNSQMNARGPHSRAGHAPVSFLIF